MTKETRTYRIAGHLLALPFFYIGGLYHKKRPMLHAVATKRRMSDVVSIATVSHDNKVQTTRESKSKIKALLKEVSEKNIALREQARIHTEAVYELNKRQRDTEQQVLRAKEASERLQLYCAQALKEKHSDKETIDKHARKIRSMEDELHQIKQKLTIAREQIKADVALTKQILEQNKQDMTKGTKDITLLIDKAQSGIRALSTEAAREAADKVSKLEAELRQSIATIEALKNDITTVRVDKGALQADLDGHKKHLAEAKAEKRELSESIRKTESIVAQQQTEITSLNDRIRDCSDTTDGLREELTRVTTISNKNNADLANQLRLNLAEYDTHISMLTDELNEAKDRMARGEFSIAQMKQRQVDLETKIEELTASKSNLASDLHKANGRIKEREAELENSEITRNATVHALEACKEEKQATLQELERVQKKHESSIKEHSLNEEQRKNEIRDLERDLRSARSDAERLRVSNTDGLLNLEKQRELLEKLQKKVIETERDLENRKNDTYGLEDTIREHTEKLRSRDTEIARLKAASDDTEQKRLITEKRIQELNTQLEKSALEHEQRVRSIKDELTSSVESLDREKEKNADLVRKLQAREKELQRVTESLTNLQELTNANDASISKITSEERRKTLEAQRQLQSTTTKFNSEKTVLTDEIRSLRTEIATSKKKQLEFEALIKEREREASEQSALYLKETNRLQQEVQREKSSNTALSEENHNLNDAIEAARSLERAIREEAKCTKSEETLMCVKSKMGSLSTARIEIDTSKANLEQLLQILRPGKESSGDAIKNILDSASQLQRESIIQQSLMKDMAQAAGCTDGTGDHHSCILKSIEVGKKVLGVLSSTDGRVLSEGADIADTVTDLVRKAEEYQKLEEENRTLLQQRQDQNKTITTTAADLENCNAAMKRITAEHGQYKVDKENTIVKLRGQLDELESTIKSLSSTIEANDTTIRNNDTVLLEMKGFIQTLEESKLELESQKESYINENMSLRTSKAELDAIVLTIAPKDEEILALKDKLSELRNRVAELRSIQDQLELTQTELRHIKESTESKRRGCLWYLDMTEIPIIDSHINLAVWQEAMVIVRSYKAQKNPQLDQTYNKVKPSASMYIEDGIAQCRASNPARSAFTRRPPVPLLKEDTENIRIIFGNLKNAAQNPVHGGPFHTITLSMQRVASNLIGLTQSLLVDGQLTPDIQKKIEEEFRSITDTAIRSMKSNLVTIIDRALGVNGNRDFIEFDIEWGRLMTGLVKTESDTERPAEDDPDQHNMDEILRPLATGYALAIDQHIEDHQEFAMSRPALICMLSVLCLLWAIAKKRDTNYINYLVSQTSTYLSKFNDYINDRSASHSIGINKNQEMVMTLASEIANPDHDDKLQEGIVITSRDIKRALSGKHEPALENENTDSTENQTGGLSTESIRSFNSTTDEDEYMKALHSELSGMTTKIKEIISLATRSRPLTPIIGRIAGDSSFGAYI